MPNETVPCATCNTPTLMTDTKRCNVCWEVEARLSTYLRSERGQKFVLEALHGSPALGDFTKSLRYRIAEALIARAQRVETIAKTMRGDFKTLAQARITYWKEAAEAIISEDPPLLRDTCPHGNELELNEDAPCGCRQVRA